LRGPNPKSKQTLRIICARDEQLEAVAKKYIVHVVAKAELEGRFARMDGYGLNSFKRINFSSREEWIREWSTPEHRFILDQARYEFYLSKEVWANDEYWAVLDKECEVGTHTSLLDHPIWHLAIRRRNEKPLHDWPIIQGIKNKVVGEEFEAIELYPADSRIMDVGNVYHLWVLAPSDGETEPPRFPVGAKNPEQGGALVLRRVMICTERTKRAFDSGEMSLDERKALVKTSKTHARLFIFPDALMPDAEKEFPGQEPVQMIHQYAQLHPEVVQQWEPTL
jgi:hypothetical protein